MEFSLKRMTNMRCLLGHRIDEFVEIDPRHNSTIPIGYQSIEEAQFILEAHNL